MVSVAETQIEKGQYIFQLANCYACHTDTENNGKPLAGGRAMVTEFGTFFTPNITADKKTGIGLWTDKEFSNAVRSGLSPDSSHYYPSFPYSSYRNISNTDIAALKTYIFSLKTVEQDNKEHQLKWYISRWSITFWKFFNRYFQAESKPAVERGDYLINTLGHCNECHTPRNILGILKMEQSLSGNKKLSAPDISSKNMNDWNNEDITDLFLYGALPNGDYVSDKMAEVVEFSTSKWNQDDLNAAIHYLRSQ